MSVILRYIIGYLVGGTIFLFLIPLGFYQLSMLDYPVFRFILFYSDILRIIFIIPFFVTGAYFMLWSNIFLFIRGKGGPSDAFGISISPQTKRLVTNGPYRYTRNPMVFGAFSFYTSFVFFLNSLACLVALLILLVLVIAYLKISEEKRLIKDFGDEYLEYRKKVAMIFPYRKIKV